MSVETSEKGTILIVDDTPTNLGILFEFLADSGFKVLVARDGESAIQKVEYAMPDLILLDVLMPGIDGFETCRRLKASESTQDIPVIFMTALSDTVDKVKGLNLGAVDYITKPLQHEEVLARVTTHLSLRNLTKRLQEQNVRLQHEIQERKQAEQKIGEQAALLDITTDAILVRDLKNQILFWNKGAERLYGWKAEEALGKNILELLYKETLPQLQTIQNILFQKGEWQGELNQVTKEGEEIIVACRWTLVRDEANQPKSILVVNTDITQKKQLEKQFLRAQRMESLGTLASGIAHDMNNVLAPILMAIQLLQMKIHDEKTQQWLEILECNVKRGADLVKQVLSFARGCEGDRKLIEIKSLLLESERIVKETFPKYIEVHTDLSQNLWSVSGDATQLHQVLINLCLNARDAMPNGGILRLSAENFSIDENSASMNIEARVGSYVVITVSDTGTGIPPEILERIFEPFFTTKDLGKGTGLGLATVMGIIKGHGGFVEVESGVGSTQFKVYLPAIETTTNSPAKKLNSKVHVGHGEVILVVDDEEAICEITKISLETHGYKVIIAKDGIEATALYAQHKEKIDVVLVDMMMPSMDGPTTIRTLEKMNPQVKIIAVSGLVSNHKMNKIIGNSVKTFLSKPYTSEDLLKTLHAVIHAH